MSQTSHPAFSPTSFDIVSDNVVEAPRPRRSVIRTIGERIAGIAFGAIATAIAVLFILLYLAVRAASATRRFVSGIAHGTSRPGRDG